MTKFSSDAINHAEWWTLIELCKTRDGPLMLRTLRSDANWSKCAIDERRWARIGNVVSSVSSMLLIQQSSLAQRSLILSWCFSAQGTCIRVPLAFIKASTSNSAELFVLVFLRLVVDWPTIGSAREVSWPAESVGATLPQYIYTQAFLTHGTGLWFREASSSKATESAGSLCSSSSRSSFGLNVSWFYHFTSCT